MPYGLLTKWRIFQAVSTADKLMKVRLYKELQSLNVNTANNDLQHAKQRINELEREIQRLHDLYGKRFNQ